jgi:hypothetical protein
MPRPTSCESRLLVQPTTPKLSPTSKAPAPVKPTSAPPTPVCPPWRNKPDTDDTKHDSGQWVDDTWDDTGYTEHDSGQWAATKWDDTYDTKHDSGQWVDYTWDDTVGTEHDSRQWDDNKWDDTVGTEHDSGHWDDNKWYDTVGTERDSGQWGDTEWDDTCDTVAGPAPPDTPPPRHLLPREPNKWKVPAGALWQAVRNIKTMGYQIEDLQQAAGTPIPDDNEARHNFQQTKRHAVRVSDMFKDANYSELDAFLQSRDGGTLSAHLLAMGKGSRSRSS